MRIENVSIIGLGALGVMYANALSKKMARNSLKVIADQGRIDKYMKEGVYSNAERCEFAYILPEEKTTPADLLIFSVNFNNLEEAVEAARNHVGDHTIIISLLNGIASEEVIGQSFGTDKIVYCVAQGMDAVKVGNRLTYAHMGQLCIGDRQHGIVSEKVIAVDNFLTAAQIPHTVETQMYRKLWSKFMANVGINQTLAVYGSSYEVVQREGEARNVMIAAMREVIALSEKEGIFLNEDDLQYWLGIFSHLSPQSKPSMRQDVEARRYSELELFAGTVLRLGRKHHIETPVNQMLFHKITEIESAY